MFALVATIPIIVLYILGIIFAFISGILSAIIFIVIGLFALAIAIPGLAVGIRRMHDVGKSGWYLLIPVYSFILAITEGEKGDNQYGPDPKAGER